MNVLFVSGASAGGSAISTSQLAERLAARGHTVGVLLPDRRLQPHLVRRSVPWVVLRTSHRALDRLVVRAAERRRQAPRDLGAPGPVRRWHARVPHAAAGPLLDEVRPDVVVAESMDATTWGPLRSLLADRRVPVVLSIHERASVARLDGTVPAPELVFVNAEVHANAVRAQGHDAVLVPSLVERPATPPGADASQVLFVNPIPGYGAEVAWALAAARPNTTFAFAESWPLVPSDVRALGRRARGHPNVHVHRLRPPEQLYREAAVLLVPYLDDNRPRVVTEAQLLGIPVLARDTPGLRESVAGGGRLVDGGAPAGAWAVALDELVAVGPSGPRPHREGEQPEILAARVEALLTQLVGS